MTEVRGRANGQEGQKWLEHTRRLINRCKPGSVRIGRGTAAPPCERLGCASGGTCSTVQPATVQAGGCRPGGAPMHVSGLKTAPRRFHITPFPQRMLWAKAVRYRGGPQVAFTGGRPRAAASAAACFSQHQGPRGGVRPAPRACCGPRRQRCSRCACATQLARSWRPPDWRAARSLRVALQLHLAALPGLLGLLRT